MIQTFDQFKKGSINEGFWDWLTGKDEKSNSPKSRETSKKEGAVDDKVQAYYKTLQDYADSKKSVIVSAETKNTFSKMVQDIQIALDFLGYKLPQYGVDGYFGPETATAIDKFNSENKPAAIATTSTEED